LKSKTGNDVREKSIGFNRNEGRSGQKWSPFGLTIGALAGVVMALIFFVACWLLVDAFVPLVGGRYLSTNVWTNTGQFSLSHLDHIIDICGLGSAVADRVIVLGGAAIGFAIATGNWVRKDIVRGGGPRFWPSFILGAFLLIVVFALTQCLATYRPLAKPQESANCISDNNYPKF
jgi:hypothetical protein